MKTTATPQSRRKSISYYLISVKRQEDQEAQARANEEAHRSNAQKHITDLCKKVMDSYTEMENTGKDMRQIEDELNEKEKEEEVFYKTADEKYPFQTFCLQIILSKAVEADGWK